MILQSDYEEGYAEWREYFEDKNTDRLISLYENFFSNPSKEVRQLAKNPFEFEIALRVIKDVLLDRSCEGPKEEELCP